MLRQARLVTFAAKSTAAQSVWANVPLGPPDPILGLNAAFRADPDPRKVNLGVGAYRDENGKPFVLESCKKAQAKAIEVDMEYAPIDGVEVFTKHSPVMVLGDNSKAISEKRVATTQSLSGTGALRLATEFINRFYPFSGEKTIYQPTPTWGNHPNIVKDSHLANASYRYYDTKTCGLDIQGLLDDLKKIPNGSVVMLHGCAHNPTGVDPSLEQWKKILEVVQGKKHFAFFDLAYQGFASGDPDKDAQAVRLFEKEGVPLLVCQSFAKNFGVYGHRVGALHIVGNNADEAERLRSQLKILIRPMYSNPPIHGARIVGGVLADPALYGLWKKEVKLMADRIISMRHKLKDALAAAGSKRNWDHITNQIGMFSFTGMKKDEVQKLTKEHHIYLTADGRISMAGITAKNVKYVADSMHAVTKTS